MATRRTTGHRPRPTDQRRQSFLRYYLADPRRNATQAAIKAGYSPRSASNTSWQLLNAPEIAEAVNKANEKLAARYEITSDKITRELALLAFSNIRDYGTVDEHGQFHIDLNDIDPDQFAALTEISSKATRGRPRVVGRGGGPIQPPRITETKIKLTDKRAALDTLAKVVGLYKDGPDISVPITFTIQRTDRSKVLQG